MFGFTLFSCIALGLASTCTQLLGFTDSLYVSMTFAEMLHVLYAETNFEPSR